MSDPAPDPGSQGPAHAQPRRRPSSFPASGPDGTGRSGVPDLGALTKDQAVRFACYNAVATVLVGLVIFATVNVFFVFQAFVTPLVWGGLVGALLYPAKALAVSVSKELFELLADPGIDTVGHVPLPLGAFLVPFILLDWLADSVIEVFVKRKYSTLLVLLGLLCIYQLQLLQPGAQKGAEYVGWAMGGLQGLSEQILSQRVFWLSYTLTAVLGLALAPVLAPGLQLNHWVLQALALPPWFCLLAALVELTGGWALPICCALGIGCLTLSPSADDEAGGADEATDTTFLRSPQQRRARRLSTRRPTAFMSRLMKKKAEPSDPFFFGLFLAFGVVKLGSLWSFLLAMLLASWWGVKRIARYCAGTGFAKGLFAKASSRCEWYKHVLFPYPIRLLWQLAVYADRRVVGALRRQLDTLFALVMIAMLLVASLLALYIVSRQVATETAIIAQLTTGAWAQAKDNYFLRWAPSLDFEAIANQTAHQVQSYGRAYAFQYLNQTYGERVNLTQLESTVNQVWVQLSEMQKRRRRPLFEELEEFLSDPSFRGKLVPGMNSLFDLDGLASVVSDLGKMLFGHVSLATHFVVQLLLVVLHGGTAIMNWAMSFLLFVSTLFYLLSSSSPRYQPIEWTTSLIPSKAMKKDLEQTLQTAIRGVFQTSAKMFIFHSGLTYVTFELFNIHLVFIPSAAAGFLAVVPFIGAYWVALPAFCELWLQDGQLVHGLVLLSLHIGATYFVDPVIYGELEGSHHFVTGLSVVGGMLLYGLQGVVVGPMALVTLLIIYKVYFSVIK